MLVFPILGIVYRKGKYGDDVLTIFCGFWFITYKLTVLVVFQSASSDVINYVSIEI